MQPLNAIRIVMKRLVQDEKMQQQARVHATGRRGARRTVPGTVLRALGLVFGLCGVLGVSGCGTSLYRLPQPAQTAPDPATINEEARPAQGAALNGAARASLTRLYALLKAGDYEPSERYLSQETREFLAHITGQPDAATALASRKMKLQAQPEVAFDPIELLLGGNIAEVRDAMEGVTKAETANRRELFVIDPQGNAHRVIFILEGGQWVLHKTSVAPSAPISTRAS